MKSKIFQKVLNEAPKEVEGKVREYAEQKTKGMYFVKKGKKYMKGHSYCSGRGYKFNWTLNPLEARQMEHETARHFEVYSGGKLISIKSVKL